MPSDKRSADLCKGSAFSCGWWEAYFYASSTTEFLARPPFLSCTTNPEVLFPAFGGCFQQPAECNQVFRSRCQEVGIEDLAEAAAAGGALPWPVFPNLLQKKLVWHGLSLLSSVCWSGLVVLLYFCCGRGALPGESEVATTCPVQLNIH